MKISVKFVQGQTEITVESESTNEILQKLDEVQEIIKKIASMSGPTKEKFENYSEGLPPSATEWTTEY